MAGLDYRDSYFEHPEDLELKLEEDFPDYEMRVWAAKTERSLLEQVKQGPVVMN